MRDGGQNVLALFACIAQSRINKSSLGNPAALSGISKWTIKEGRHHPRKPEKPGKGQYVDQSKHLSSDALQI